MSSTTDNVKELAEKLSQVESEQETVRVGVHNLTERVEKMSVPVSENKSKSI